MSLEPDGNSRLGLSSRLYGSSMYRSEGRYDSLDAHVPWRIVALFSLVKRLFRRNLVFMSNRHKLCTYFPRTVRCNFVIEALWRPGRSEKEDRDGLGIKRSPFGV